MRVLFKAAVAAVASWLACWGLLELILNGAMQRGEQWLVLSSMGAGAANFFMSLYFSWEESR